MVPSALAPGVHVILLLTLLITRAGASEAAPDVIVERIQTAPGQAPTGFRIEPDGTWSELDGTWTQRVRLDAVGVAAAEQAVAGVGEITVPAPVGTAGASTWRLGDRSVTVPEGLGVPALGTLYTSLQGLLVPVPSTSLWTVSGVVHPVRCSAAKVPALALLTAIWIKAPAAPQAGVLEVHDVPLIDVRWFEGGEAVGRSVVLEDGRVGSTFEGRLMHHGTLTNEGLGRLGAALSAVGWPTVCSQGVE